MAYVSWFTKTSNWALKGINICGSVHKMSPISEGNTWEKFDCPKCNSINAFLFRSHNNGKVYGTFCIKCKKVSDVSEAIAKRKSKQCKGIKRDGSQCKLKAQPGRTYCRYHS